MHGMNWIMNIYGPFNIPHVKTCEQNNKCQKTEKKNEGGRL